MGHISHIICISNRTTAGVMRGKCIIVDGWCAHPSELARKSTHTFPPNRGVLSVQPSDTSTMARVCPFICTISLLAIRWVLLFVADKQPAAAHFRISDRLAASSSQISGIGRAALAKRIVLPPRVYLPTASCARLRPYYHANTIRNTATQRHITRIYSH